MKVELEISSRRIADLMVSALEGGSGYWLESATLMSSSALKKIEQPKAPWYDEERIFDEAFQIEIVEDEPHKKGHNGKWTVTFPSVQQGLRLMAENSGGHFGDFMSENGDAITADVFLQYITFGEVIYG